MKGAGRLRELIAASRRAVVFTGAGISTESGISDFRSPGGIWSRHKPVYFDDFMASEARRRDYWRLKFLVDTVISWRSECSIRWAWRYLIWRWAATISMRHLRRGLASLWNNVHIT